MGVVLFGNGINRDFSHDESLMRVISVYLGYNINLEKMDEDLEADL